MEGHSQETAVALLAEQLSAFSATVKQLADQQGQTVRDITELRKEISIVVMQVRILLAILLFLITPIYGVAVITIFERLAKA